MKCVTGQGKAIKVLESGKVVVEKNGRRFLKVLGGPGSGNFGHSGGSGDGPGGSSGGGGGSKGTKGAGKGKSTPLLKQHETVARSAEAGGFKVTTIDTSNYVTPTDGNKAFDMIKTFTAEQFDQASAKQEVEAILKKGGLGIKVDGRSGNPKWDRDSVVSGVSAHVVNLKTGHRQGSVSIGVDSTDFMRRDSNTPVRYATRISIEPREYK